MVWERGQHLLSWGHISLRCQDKWPCLFVLCQPSLYRLQSAFPRMADPVVMST